MNSRIRDRKATVPEKETAWKSDYKWQSYRRRREHERKWAFSASLRRFPSKTMKLRIQGSKSDGSRERIRLKIGSQMAKLSKTTQPRTKVSILSVFETFSSKSCDSRERNRLKIGSQTAKLSKTTRTRTKVSIFTVFETSFQSIFHQRRRRTSHNWVNATWRFQMKQSSF